MADQIPTRKIIQISSSITSCEIPTITALCDDGTVWTLIQARQAGWERVIDIPQDGAGERPKKIGEFD